MSDLISREAAITAMSSHFYDRTSRAYAEETIRALPAVTPAVKVKPLEWVAHPSAPIWRCDTPLGPYKVFALEPYPSWDFDSATDAKDKISKRSNTPQAAKAAAQADYEARILSALDVKPAPTLAEAAKVLLDAWDADDFRVVGPWAEADDINGVQFGNVLRRIAEGQA